MILPHAPASLLSADGQPLLGRYAGQTGHIDWERLAPPYAHGALWLSLIHI